MWEQIRQYINPIKRLGKKDYSILFPALVTLLLAIIIEVIVVTITNDGSARGIYAIFLFVATIIYFAFHDGIRGGITAVAITIAYYSYIIVTGDTSDAEKVAQWQTVGGLLLLYLLLAGIIGWLKETIDNLIEKEADGRKRLQRIIEQLPVGVVITDSKGTIIHANKKLNVILGRKIPIGFQIKKELLLNISIDGRKIPPSQGVLAVAIAAGKSIIGKEITIRRPDNKEVIVQVSMSPIENKAGKIIAFAAIIYDITAQKDLEKRKDDFVNMASHELKTPITSLKLYIDSLALRMSKYNDEKAVKTLNGIRYQTDRLQDLISDLLDVSRLQTGKLTFNKENFRIDVLIEETIEGLQGSVKQHIIEFPKKSPTIVYADKFRIYQVLTNLLTNAIKYSPTLTVITVSIKRSHGKVIVSVKDRGIGISKSQQKRIFDRLYQVTDSTEKTFPGLGMGLYISKEIIKRHRGSIWVESEKNIGTTFYFSLPQKIIKNK